MRKHFKTVDEINLELSKLNDDLDNIAEDLKTKDNFDERLPLYDQIDKITKKAMKLDSLAKKMLLKDLKKQLKSVSIN